MKETYWCMFHRSTVPVGSRSGSFEFNLKSHFYLFFRLYISHIEDI